MRKFATMIGGSLVFLAFAGPLLAAAPDREHLAFTTDPYVLAECDGYAVLQQDEVSLDIVTYYDRQGNISRTVFHASNTGLVWRNDTNVQLGTYSDAGGTFTASAEGTFTFTGVHFWYEISGSGRLAGTGRVVVSEVTPGDFQQTFSAGQFSEVDACAW